MKRKRPRAHYRIIKTKKGKKRILVNKKVRRRREPNYAYATGVINTKREENQALAREVARHRVLRDSATFGSERIRHENQINKIKREIASNGEDIDQLNKRIFPKNPR